MVIDAAVLVRTARQRAHMSARDLAAASGVSPSTVTRIERGELKPTLSMLERLLDASGNDLEVVARPRAPRPTIDALRARRDEIIEAVESLGGSNVRVFGSVARGDARPDSDVDVLVDVPEGTGLVVIGQMTEAIEALVPWRVDVVTSGTARGRMVHITDEAVPL